MTFRVLVRASMLVLALSLAAAGWSRTSAQEAGPSPADRRAIQAVIARQLDAFRRDDARTAFAMAAPVVKRTFPAQDVFMDMVRRSYQPVYRPAQQEFGELAMRDGRLVQEVELVGADGRHVLALYAMERQADGTWLIAGCSLVPSARLGV